MNGIAAAVAILISSTGVSPALETSPATVVPAAFTFHLPDGAAAPRSTPHRRLIEQSRWTWGTGTLEPAQATPVKRFSKVDRIIAVVAGTCIGWVAGGAIGWAATAAGAIIGFRLTK
jgi:hypothetical protein